MREEEKKKEDIEQATQQPGIYNSKLLHSL
jgi:hypothetical protein